MSLKSTIYKAHVNVADMDRNVYVDQSLTLAKHPSETEQRMMLRILGWCLFADENLQFTKGLCVDSEPELWKKTYCDTVELWIELGLPDEKRIKRACSLSSRVVLLTYNDNASSVWKKQSLNKLYPFANLTVINVQDEILDAAANEVERTMSIQATIEDELVWFSIGDKVISIKPDMWKRADI
ncbi:YaeQ family protein [Veronia pacifica]|uniref:YaeQ family protein n=1 Tax=Veronia pacifica TaxID=1080227 RepID=A0A1C3EMU1_9GAMM|nr:YaeQ family protein [Veronia pacifica]ODA34563.1 hypothetical protein A8L45_06235 [Veronia pacifica]